MILLAIASVAWAALGVSFYKDHTLVTFYRLVGIFFFVTGWANAEIALYDASLCACSQVAHWTGTACSAALICASWIACHEHERDELPQLPPARAREVDRTP